MMILNYQRNIGQRLALRPRLNGRFMLEDSGDEIERVRGAIYASVLDAGPVRSFDSTVSASLAIQTDPTGVVLLDGAKLIWDTLTDGDYVIQCSFETVNEKVWYSPQMILRVSKALINTSPLS